MATTLTIGGASRTAYIRDRSMTCKLNSLDVVLVDPPTTPVIGAAVTLAGPAWSGNVSAVGKSDPVDRQGHVLVTVTATNTVVASASAAPFGLSDAPDGVTTFGYRRLSARTQLNLDGSTSTRGTLETTTPGLWPAMTFALTSANQGYSATSFSVVNVTVTWPTAGSPVYLVEFGDPIVTMGVWAASQAGSAPDGSISGTKITDGSVSTPKLAANAVTADKIAVGAITADKNAGDAQNEAPNPIFGLLGSTTVLDTSGGVGNLPGWAPLTQAAAQYISSTATQKVGLYSWWSAQPATPANIDLQSAALPVVPGRTYRLSAWVRGLASNGAGAKANFFVRYLDANQASLGFITAAAGGSAPLLVGASTAWAQMAAYYTIPATASYVKLGLENSILGAAGDDVGFDAVEWYPVDYDLRHAAGSVVIDSTGVTITNGALTVANAGGTVVIDGTSDMFKISATGTLSYATAAPPPTVSGQASATLSGLGVQTATLGYLGYIASGNSTAAQQRSQHHILYETDFVSATSGGAVTRSVGTIISNARIVSYLSGGYLVVGLAVDSFAIPPATHYMRYYVLQEAAM